MCFPKQTGCTWGFIPQRNQQRFLIVYFKKFSEDQDSSYIIQDLHVLTGAKEFGAKGQETFNLHYLLSSSSLMSLPPFLICSLLSFHSCPCFPASLYKSWEMGCKYESVFPVFTFKYGNLNTISTAHRGGKTFYVDGQYSNWPTQQPCVTTESRCLINGELETWILLHAERHAYREYRKETNKFVMDEENRFLFKFVTQKYVDSSTNHKSYYKDLSQTS